MANFITDDDKRIRDLQELSELLLSDFLPVDRPGFLGARRITVQQIVDLLAESAPIQNLSGGASNPDNASGNNGDFYIKANETSVAFYQKSNDEWISIISFDFQSSPIEIPFDFDESSLTTIDMTSGDLPEYGSNPRIEVWLILEDATEILYNPGSIVKTKTDGVLQTVRFPDIEGGIGFAPSKKGYYLIAK